jgi:hypothetical protein
MKDRKSSTNNVMNILFIGFDTSKKSRYILDLCESDLLNNIGSDFKIKKINSQEFRLWDFSSEEQRFGTIAPSHINRMDAFILCPTDVIQLNNLYNILKKSNKENHTCFVIIDEAILKKEDIKHLQDECETLGLEYIQAPSKSNAEQILKQIEADVSLKTTQRQEKRRKIQTQTSDRRHAISTLFSSIPSIPCELSELIQQYDLECKKASPK